MTASPRTALILVDVINSFFEPGQTNYYDAAPSVLPPIRLLLAAARASASVIVHAAERHRPKVHDFEWRKLPVHHVEGDASSGFVTGFEPAGSEAVIYKRRYSAFFATDLALFLNEQEIRRAVICGVKTNCCIRATAQDAFANGIEPVIAREATNSNRPHLAAASLEDIDRYLGRVVSIDDAVGMFA